MSPALAPGRQLTMVAGVSSFTSENRIANYQSLTPGGCVAEWGKTVRHMNGLVVYLGLLFRTMLPPHRDPAALFPQLLGVCRGTASGAYAIFGCTSYRGLASYG